MEGQRRDSLLRVDLAGDAAMMGVQAMSAQLFYAFCLDDHVPSSHMLRSIDLLVAEPPEVVLAGVNITGAYYLYALSIFTDDARYAASMEGTDMPIEFVDKIVYQRE